MNALKMFWPKMLAGASTPPSAELMRAEKSAPTKTAIARGGRYFIPNDGRMNFWVPDVGHDHAAGNAE